MPLMREIAERMSNNELLQGVVEEIIDRESLLELLPFSKADSKATVYTREETLSEGVYLNPNEDVPEEASTVTEHVAKLKILIGDVDVDKFLNSTMSDTNSQLGIQIAMKAKGMMRQFKRQLIQGDEVANAKTFNGINKLCAETGNEFAAGVNGGALDLAMLDELSDAVRNGVDCFMMREGTLRALKQLWRVAGGNTGGMLQINNFGLQVPAHDGVPILVNDFIPGNIAQGTAPATCSIYAIRFNEADGLHGLYGGDEAGFVMEDIGTVQNRDALRTRLKWYHSLVLKSTQSMAALRGITNV